jgi:hypothetical protein
MLPVFDYLQKRPARSAIWVVGLIVAYSLWWQVNGAIFFWGEYSNLLPPESSGFTTWLPSTTQIKYMRPLLLTPLWFKQSLDFAWVRIDNTAWPVIFSLLAIGNIAILKYRHLLWGWRSVGVAISLPLLFTGGVYWALADLYDHDPEVRAEHQALHQVAALLDLEETPDDVLLVNDPLYHTFILNYADFDYVRAIVLPYAPGERGSFEQTPQVVSDNLEDLLSQHEPGLIAALAEQRERLWVLMETGPYIPWSIRPLEQFMAAHYYPIREIQADPPDPTVRLLEYSTIQAPAAETPPAIATELLFGESIHLAGVTLPAGTNIPAGGVLAVTLYWQTEAVLTNDYHVALFLADNNDNIVAQGMDGAPQGGFAPTTSWPLNTLMQDNRALRLPEDLPPGDYELWVRLYTWDAEGMTTLPVTSEGIIGDDIGVLPVSIEIE